MNDAEIFEAQLNKLKKKYKKLIEVKDLGLYKQKKAFMFLYWMNIMSAILDNHVTLESE